MTSVLFSLESPIKRQYQLAQMLKSPKVPDKVRPNWPNPILGQLALKEEAAGKIRVFAIVDMWTQSLLSPLHLYLFSILKRIPCDGTFDQGSSVKRASEKCIKAGCSFGYDLSAATDRLPILLQMALISELFSFEFARDWARLLVGREYYLPKSDHSEEGSYSYSVGQPMGALSS
jgi:hypothetical protein